MNFGRTWSAIAVFAAACFAGVPASALAETAASQEDFEKWCTGAIRGDASSQYNLALCYRKGLHVAASAETAAEWFLKAAKQDFIPAQIELANCYDSGAGVPADRSEAAAWLLRVAEKGFARAQFLYAVRCMKGDGVPEDKAKVVSWFEKAAQQKMASAQFYLGFCYAKGEGVEADKEEAFSWFEKAARQGLAEAQYNLGLCYRNGDGVNADDEEAAEWFSKAARKNVPPAQYYYGECLLRGKGVDEDKSAAAEWLKLAAAHGIESAHRLLGEMYFEGAGVPESKPEAARRFRIAAEKGDVSAQRRYGECLFFGTGVASNAAESEKWLASAANAGDADAKNFLARNAARRKAEARAEAERVAAEKRRLAAQEAERVAAERRARESSALAALNVDQNIPENPQNARPLFVCVVANENYSQSGAADVAYAKNDGVTFAAYAKKTLGVPERNVRVFTDATAGTMRRAEIWLERCTNLYPNSEVIFYYAGHGVPVIENGRVTKQCLLPTDVPVELSSALGVDLARTGAPTSPSRAEEETRNFCAEAHRSVCPPSRSAWTIRTRTRRRAAWSSCSRKRDTNSAGRAEKVSTKRSTQTKSGSGFSRFRKTGVLNASST